MRARRYFALYLALLLASQLVAALRSDPPTGRAGFALVELPHRSGEGLADGTVEVCFEDIPADHPDAPTLLLVHGSPGDLDGFQPIIEQLRGKYRLIVPDLPGFGGSTRLIADYSFATHGRTLLDLMDVLQIDAVHALGFSMGGGVILTMADLEPERIKSVTLLAAIGVQELELFGSYELNHAVHGFQLFALQAARTLIPHFGAIAKSGTLRSYARNFYDSDQRPLRDMLESWQGPALVIHGARDFLVPVSAAKEHLRIVPQARSEIWPDASHFLPWTEQQRISEVWSALVDDTEAGVAQTREQVSAAASSRAQLPWNPLDAPPLTGFALLIAVFLLAAATLVSEDLTCIATGLIVAQGRLPFIAGAGACFFGILIGDGLLFLAGRWLGRPALARAPLRWMVRVSAVHRASVWFEKKGGKVILLSRFLPGLRLPTYVAAGMLGQKLRSFFFYFALAGLIWTPLLVGISTWAGKEVLEGLHAVEGYAVPILITLAFTILFAQKLILPVFTHRGRRMLYASWRRKLEWEFWPPQVFYLPVIAQILWLAIRYRSLRVVTAANPLIPTGGVVGEPKREILDAVAAQGSTRLLVPKTCFLAAEDPARATKATRFIDDQQLNFPLVVKPNCGERGRGVEIVRSIEQVRQRLAIDPTDLLLQEYIEGEEFGVFYIRYPNADRGQIFSINGKQLPSVTGDGTSTLEQLILADERAVRLAEVHFEYHAEALDRVLPAGEKFPLVEVGAHARGTVFIDRRNCETEALLAALDQACAGLDGFHIGRFDLRVPDEEHLKAGEQLYVLELNGLTAEAAHIYHPGSSVFDAWTTTMRQWRIAFEIGAQCKKLGARPSTWGEIWQAWGESKRQHRAREEAFIRAELAEQERKEKDTNDVSVAAQSG